MGLATNLDGRSRWGDPRRVVDAHNDLLLELVKRRAEPTAFSDRWLDQLTAGGVALQVCPLYVWWDETGDGALRSALEQVVAWTRACEESEAVRAIHTRGDLDRAIAADQLGLMLSIEGAEVLAGDPFMLDVFGRLGVRMIGLTHFARNAFADGNGERSDGGLSTLGRELVDRIAALGMVLDLAHASPRTFADVLDHPATPRLLISHSGCRALFDDPRNVDDGQLRRLAERDGVIGIYAVPTFLGGDRADSIERVADHVLHAVEAIGPRHVGVTGDFTHQLHGVPGLVRFAPWAPIDQDEARRSVLGLEGPAGYPRLAAALERRGLRGEELEAVLHGNFLRLLREALPPDPTDD